MKVFVVGATGEVGSQLVKQLAEHELVNKVEVIVRRPVEFESEKVEVKVIEDFANIKAADLAGCEAGFSALGTTRAKANPEQYQKIDHDYPVHVASVAKSAGCRYFGLVSSAGANSSSWLSYPRRKAQTEEDCAKVGPACFSVFRPGFLVCDRRENRVGELIALKTLVPVLNWIGPGRYSVETSKLAGFMIKDSLERIEKAAEGSIIYENSQIV